MEKQRSSNGEIRMTMDMLCSIAPPPVYVKIFKGFSTGGEPIYEVRCVCPVCLDSTCPIHGNVSVEEE